MFSWPAFALVAALALCLALTWVRLYLLFHARTHRATRAILSPGGAGLQAYCSLSAGFWRGTGSNGSSLCSRHTFALLWVSTSSSRMRTARGARECLLTHAPRQHIFDHAVSFKRCVWWYFEYLNRFVQNWHYVNHAATTPLAYIGHATLAFRPCCPLSPAR